MTRMSRSSRAAVSCVAVLCVVAMCASLALAADWPQWRGPNRDGKVTGFTAPAAWPKALVQKWKVSVGSGDGTPALVGDKLYVFTRQGDDEVTLCLNAADGKEVWRDKYAAQAVMGAASRHPGPRGSPTVVDGKVLTFGVGGILSCLNAADGKMIWRKDEFPKVVPRFFTAMSPLVVDGMVIAQVGGSGKGGIVAFDLATGDVKWKWEKEGPEYSSPMLLTADGVKQIVALTDKSVVGVGAADGKSLWQLPFVPAMRAYNAATPIVDGATAIVTGAGRGTKAVKVEKQGDGFTTKELWSNPKVAVQFNTPVLRDGLLFGLSDKGNLFCLNAKTGETAWLDAMGRDRGGFGSVLDAGTVLVAVTSNGEMVVYEPSDKEYKELAKYKVADSATYAQPLIAGKLVYVKDADSVILWSLE